MTERWRCPTSPTGAHWELLTTPVPLEPTLGTCKFCGKQHVYRAFSREDDPVESWRIALIDPPLALTDTG